MAAMFCMCQSPTIERSIDVFTKGITIRSLLQYCSVKSSFEVLALMLHALSP